MTLATQNAIVAYLRALPIMEGLTIHGATDDKEIPGDQPVIVVACDNAESPVAKLYRATVQITLSTPVLLEDSLETHRALTTALRTAANLAAVATFFPPTLVYSGRHLTTWNETREDERLTTTAELVVGVREI
jgi:hypothetical protein